MDFKKERNSVEGGGCYKVTLVFDPVECFTSRIIHRPLFSVLRFFVVLRFVVLRFVDCVRADGFDQSVKGVSTHFLPLGLGFRRSVFLWKRLCATSGLRPSP